MVAVLRQPRRQDGLGLWPEVWPFSGDAGALRCLRWLDAVACSGCENQKLQCMEQCNPFYIQDLNAHMPQIFMYRVQFRLTINEVILNKIKVSRLAGLAKGAEYIDVLAMKNSLGFNLSKKFYSVRTFKKIKILMSLAFIRPKFNSVPALYSPNSFYNLHIWH
jgi:hypothetical protein